MKTVSSRWFTFLFTLFVHGLATRGRPAASTDTALYVQLADGFLARNVSETMTIAAVRWTKTVFIALLALARGLSPNHWMGIMVALNVVCSAIVATLLVDLVRRATRSELAPVVALLLYVGSYEVVQWLGFVLTDLLYSAVAFVPFYIVARRIVIEDEPRRPVLLTASLLLAAFTRPPGLVLIPLVLFVELVLVERRVRPRVAAIVIAVAAVTAISVRTAVVNDPSVWPFRFVKPKIVEFSIREKTGEVIMGRTDTFRPPPHSAADHAVIVADRFVRYFQVTAGGFSRGHNLMNIVSFGALYALGAIAIVEAFRRGERRRRALVVALLTWIGVFALFHALTVLDFDWRFRTPLMPQFIVLAACGADALAARWSRGGGERAR